MAHQARGFAHLTESDTHQTRDFARLQRNSAIFGVEVSHTKPSVDKFHTPKSEVSHTGVREVAHQDS